MRAYTLPIGNVPLAPFSLLKNLKIKIWILGIWDRIAEQCILRPLGLGVFCAGG